MRVYADVAITLNTMNDGKFVLCANYRIWMGHVACALAKGHISQSANQNSICGSNQSWDCHDSSHMAGRRSRIDRYDVLVSGPRWHDLGSRRIVRLYRYEQTGYRKSVWHLGSTEHHR